MTIPCVALVSKGLCHRIIYHMKENKWPSLALWLSSKRGVITCKPEWSTSTKGKTPEKHINHLVTIRSFNTLLHMFRNYQNHKFWLKFAKFAATLFWFYRVEPPHSHMSKLAVADCRLNARKSILQQRPVLMLRVFATRIKHMMTSSNRNIFRATSRLWGEITGPGEFPTQRPVTWSFDVFFHLRLNKRLSKEW